MVMPMAGRVVAAVAGGLLVLAAWASVTGTLIVSRSIGGWLTRWVDRIVNGAFGLTAGAVSNPTPPPPRLPITSGVTGCSPLSRRRSC